MAEIVQDEFAGAVNPFQGDEFAGAVNPFQKVKQEQPQEPMSILSVDSARENLQPWDRSFAEMLPDPSGFYAEESLHDFFGSQFLSYDKTTADPVLIGQTLYGSETMGATEIHSRINSDIQNGEINERLKKARWIQYGYTEKQADIFNMIEEYPLAEQVAFYSHSTLKGFVKAAGGLAVGAGELFLPQKAEEVLGVKAGREFLNKVDTYQQERIYQALADGNGVDFFAKTVGMFAGDMAGQLWTMKQGLKVANKLMGTQIGLTSKKALWAEVAKDTALKSSVFATMTFIKTEGTVEDRLKSAGLTYFYMMTPTWSSKLPTDSAAIAVDILSNVAGTTMFTQGEDKTLNPVEAFKNKISALQESAKETADGLGNPDEWEVVFWANMAQEFGQDVVFGFFTRSVKGTQRADARAQTMESARLLKPFSDQSFDSFKQTMNQKYGTEGDGFLKKMDDVDRIEYEGRRAANYALEKGELPEPVNEIRKDFGPRVSVEAGRIVDYEPTWRDSKGRLRNAEAPTQEAPRDTEQPIREQSLNLEEAVAGLERAMMSDKSTEVIKTNADIGTGEIPDQMRLGVKDSVDVRPPDINSISSKNIDWWMDRQIIHIAKLVRMGELTTFKDYEEYLDSYTQRGDVDHRMIWEESKKAAKKVVTEQKAAEKQSAKGKVTQSQFKRPKDMVLIDSMNIIKDRIKALQEGIREGKKIGVEQEKVRGQRREAKLKGEIIYNKLEAKERKAFKKEIVSEALKIVDAVVDGSNIDKKALTKARFKSKAKDLLEREKVSSEDLTKFIDKVTEYASLRQEVLVRKNLRDSVMDDLPKNVDARYAEAISEIQDMISTDTSAKSAWRLEQQRKLLERNPDVQLPEKVLTKLQQTRVDEIPTETLKQLADEVERLKTQGQTVLKLRRSQEKKELSAIVKQIKTTAKKPKEGKAIDTGMTKLPAFAGLRYTFGTGALRPWNLVDMLDGGKAKYDGTAFKELIEKPNDAYSQYLRMSDTRLRTGENFLRELGFSIKEFNVKHKVGKEKLTTDELMTAYASSKNRLMHNAVLHGYFKGDKEAYDKAVSIIANSDRLKAVADYIIHDYATNYDRVRRAHIKNENRMLGQEENYVPMYRADVDKASSMEDIAAMLNGRFDANKKLPDNKFTLGRKEIPEEYQKPVKMGLYRHWEKSVNDQERYINMFESVKKMNGIIQDMALRDQMTQAYGSDYVKSLDSYVDAYGNPMSIYDTTSGARYSKNWRRRTAAGFLAYNFVTMAKQTPSLLLYMGQGGTRNMLLSVDDYNASWRMENGKLVNDLIRFVEEKDPQVAHAHLERELSQIKDTDRATYDKYVGKFTDTGLKGIAALDKMVRTIGWNSVYLDSLQKGMSEQEAISRARSATMRTQPTASAKDLPAMYKEGEWKNWMLMFSNQLNQLWNLGTYQVPRNLRSDPKAAIGVSAGLIANSIAMYVINNHKLPETEDEVQEMFMDTSLASVPLVGSSIVGATKGYDTGNPLFSSLNRSTKKIMKMREGGEEASAEEWYELMKNLTPIHGLPIRPLERIPKGEMFGRGKQE